MGSLDRAVLTGFICRLCSEMHRVVLHIYGEEGTRLSISEKISRYLSINISRSDPLPKTICKSCLERLESQHRLVMVMERAAVILKQTRTEKETDRGKENSDNNNTNEPSP
uniref:ZAD domain-containing protein n=1 Tax=Heliothis virescens TaxID=7102 RepID=A0A2A4J2C3_HELVI